MGAKKSTLTKGIVMKFHEVAHDLTKSVLQASQSKFNKLMLELGIRETNEHVGSGLGGNNFQLLVCMGLQHHLVNSRNIQISVTGKGIAWGSRFLTDAPMKDIRRKLDVMFSAVQEKHKFLAVAMQTAIDNPTSYYKGVYEYRKNFPSLVEYLKQGTYFHNTSIPLPDQLLLALFITADLAMDLDRGSRKKISCAGKALNNFPDEIYLLAVRRNIQIDRLVIHNLDEHPDWKPALLRISQGVE
jgi:hypothetical protein